MDWIKRNLYFLVGSIVALLLMGLAGFYFYSKLQLNNEIMQKLDEQFAELQRLSSEKPHPGYGQVNNIQTAKEQEQQARQTLKKVRLHFEPIPAIPDTPKVTSQDFSASLRRTIDQLQRQATNSSVNLPPSYSFSFEAQKPRVTFAVGSLEPLAVQLGEVKAICNILFEAKINSLDNLRRERVSADDAAGPQTDYLEQASVTNELAVLTSYELDFRCFSTELAAALAGFGSSAHGILVRTINVEQAVAMGSMAGDPLNPEAPGYAPPPIYMPNPGMVARPRAANPEAEYARRYGAEGPAAMPGMPGGGARGGIALRPLGAANPAFTPPAPAYYPGRPTPGQAAAQRGGLPTVLDERQLKITMTLQIIKLLPSKKAGANPAP